MEVGIKIIIENHVRALTTKKKLTQSLKEAKYATAQ